MNMELLQTSDNKEAIIPPWTIWKGRPNKQQKEEWFVKHLEILEKLSEGRIQTHVNNLLWYTGQYDQTLEYRTIVPGRGEQPIPRRILPRIFAHLSDITEQRVSRLSRFKPSFDVIPTNDESNDRTVAILIKYCLQALQRKVMMEFLMQGLERWCAVMGEVLCGVEWNKNLGDRKGFRSVERIGDVDIYLKPPWTWFPEPKLDRTKVTWGIDMYDIMHFEDARAKFNDKTIVADGKRNVFTFNESSYEKRDDEVIIYRLIQIPTEKLPEGNVSWFVNDKLVDEETTYPYSHMDFPFEWHTDIDVPGQIFPMSFYQWLIPVQHVYNRLTSIMVRNMLYVGHPHILNPIGSGARRESFGNAPTEIRFTPVGGFRPEIITFKSVPQEFFQFRTEVRNEMNQLSGIQGVSRGAPPPGVRAASMLRFYAEQEEQRASTQIIKHNELIRRIYWKAASIIGDYYPQNKDRLIRVVGPENQYLIDSFQDAKISSEYDVVIINSTGFSEDMSGRLEEVALISQLEKESGEKLLTPEEKAEVLQLRNPQKAYDIITSAQRCAQLNIEYFRRGKPVPEPQRYWDLPVHWRETMIFINSPEWQKIPEDRRAPVIEHLIMLERLMEEKGKQNAAFAQKLETLDNYPAAWNPTEQLADLQPKEAQPGAMPQNGTGMPPAAVAALTALGASPPQPTVMEPPQPAVPPQMGATPQPPPQGPIM